MRTRSRITTIKHLLRRGLRYVLVSRGFIILEAILVLACLFFLLTGSRIMVIDRFGNRDDILASIIVTLLAATLVRSVNRRVLGAIDRRFFRESYDAQIILTELGKVVRDFSDTNQLTQQVAAKITDALHPANINVFLAKDEDGDFVPAFTTNHAGLDAQVMKGPASTLALPCDGVVVQRFNETSFAIVIDLRDSDGLFGCAGPRERMALRRVRAELLIPIASNGGLLGILSLGRRMGDLPYSPEDGQLLLAVAGQMAVAIENFNLIHRLADEERIRRELEMAAEVQRRLFPAGGLEVPGLELYGLCLPAHGVGGDYYDYFEMNDHSVGIAIADVSGKGIAAALVMSTVQALLRSYAESGDRPLTETVSVMSRQLRRSTEENVYVTLFYAQFDERSRILTYVNAGHNPPMLVRGASIEGASGVKAAETVTPVTTLTAGGLFIGSPIKSTYEQAAIQLQTGDMLVAYTDGVTEAMNPEGNEFGENRLRPLILQSLRLSAGEMAERIVAALRDWQGDVPQYDDITLVVAKVK